MRNGILASPFSSPMPFVVALCLFSSSRCHPISTKWHWGEMKASLLQSGVTVTDGRVHSAETNSSGGKHDRVEGGRRKALPGSPFRAGSGRRATCFHRCGEGCLSACGGRSHSCMPPQRPHPTSHQVPSSLMLKPLSVSLLTYQFIQTSMISYPCYFFFLNFYSPH